MENTSFRQVKCFTLMEMSRLKLQPLKSKPLKFKHKMVNRQRQLLNQPRPLKLSQLKLHKPSLLNNKLLQQNNNHKLNNKFKLKLLSIKQLNSNSRHKLTLKQQRKPKHKPKLQPRLRLKHKHRHKQKLRHRPLLKLKLLNLEERQIFKCHQLQMLTRPPLLQLLQPNLFQRRNHLTK